MPKVIFFNDLLLWFYSKDSTDFTHLHKYSTSYSFPYSHKSSSGHHYHSTIGYSPKSPYHWTKSLSETLHYSVTPHSPLVITRNCYYYYYCFVSCYSSSTGPYLKTKVDNLLWLYRFGAILIVGKWWGLGKWSRLVTRIDSRQMNSGFFCCHL